MATMVDESKYPTRIAPFGLRIPPDLKDRIQAAASAANRSMNAEIIATLEDVYPEPSDIAKLTSKIKTLTYRLETAADAQERSKVKAALKATFQEAALAFSADPEFLNVLEEYLSRRRERLVSSPLGVHPDDLPKK